MGKFMDTNPLNSSFNVDNVWHESSSNIKPTQQDNVVRPLENKNAKHSKDIVGKVVAVALIAFLVCGYFYG